MTITILAFGIAKDILATNSLAIEFEGETTNDLKTVLEKQFPKLKELPAYLLAVNDEYANETSFINKGDEIAIIPPVSGG